MTKSKVRDGETKLSAKDEDKAAGSRRRFLTGAAGAVAGGAAMVAAPNVSRAQTVTL